jgi:dTDP-4-dehydrorhamnose reductase
MKTWVTGAGGLIGNYLAQLAPRFAAGRDVRAITRAALDLADFAAVTRAFREDRPSLVIHCAALSKSPACQADPALARRLNIDVTRHLAELAANIPFIFFSTDLVFDGRQGNYVESDTPHPLSIYAETKLAAEQLVARNPRHTIIRTSLNGGVSPTRDRGFNEEMRRAWHAGQAMTLFTDEFRSPIQASVTARAVWELAANNLPGIFHLCGSERLSRFQIGQLIAARWPELKPQIRPGSLKEYHGAPRAPDTCLDCSKLQKILSFPLPGLTSWLAENPGEIF